VLVGNNSYGKGSVQSIVEFEDGGALRLTTAAYRLPDGRTIDSSHPLVPDIPVDATPESSPRRRLTAAIDTHAPDDQTRSAWMADLASLRDPAVDPEAPAPIPLGATPADYVGTDPVLDAAIAHLAPQ
jgi:C-terminal processing protease CtpA/Prc